MGHFYKRYSTIFPENIKVCSRTTLEQFFRFFSWNCLGIVLKVSFRTLLVLELFYNKCCAFARTIVEQSIVLYNVLQLSHIQSRPFLEQFQSSYRTQLYEILELF